jgi:hypothetical protein
MVVTQAVEAYHAFQGRLNGDLSRSQDYPRP